MKKKDPIHKTYSFHSISSPHDFIEKIREAAVHSNLKMEQVENGFDLQIGSHHGGRIVYRATVSADDHNGSLIHGEMITIPWNNQPQKKKNFFQKIMWILGCIIILPFVLIFLLCYEICLLFVRLFHGKNIELTNEEKLCDFMTSQLCCQKREV